jgi:hypothetical protein
MQPSKIMGCVEMLTESCEKIRLKSYPHEVVLYRELSTSIAMGLNHGD